MTIQLTSCDAPRPDRRAITKLLEDIAIDVDASLALELTDCLLEGTSIDIEISEKTTSSSFRALRKLSIDYDILT